MVQPGGVHGVSTRVRGSSDRLVGVGEEVLLGTVLQAALHIQAWRIHQRPEFGGAGSQQGDDPGQQPPKLHVPPRSVACHRRRLQSSMLTHAPDNAIPIQGWINDPTDNDLQHLVPFLEGLQYVSDVRALLALRGGEDGQHMVP